MKGNTQVVMTEKNYVKEIIEITDRSSYTRIRCVRWRKAN